MQKGVQMLKKEVNIDCRYSTSCFTCPLPECTINAKFAPNINLLPGDMEIKSKRSKSTKKVISDANKHSW